MGGSSCEGDSQEIQECSMKPCMGGECEQF